MLKKLVGHTELWWQIHKIKHMVGGYCESVSWDYMKRFIRGKFVPPYYQDEQFENLLKLKQGCVSIREYAQEFEMLIRRCALNESSVYLISRFIRGLN